MIWYLSSEAIHATLDRLATLPAATSLVFDYVVPRDQWAPDGDEPDERAVALERGLTLQGEPWLTLLDDTQVGSLLRDHGFDDVTTDDARAMAHLYDTGSSAMVLPCFALASGRRAEPG